MQSYKKKVLLILIFFSENFFQNLLKIKIILGTVLLLTFWPAVEDDDKKVKFPLKISVSGTEHPRGRGGGRRLSTCKSAPV